MKLKVLKPYFFMMLMGLLGLMSLQSMANDSVSMDCQQMQQATHCDCCQHEVTCDQGCADHCLMMFSVSHFSFLQTDGWMPPSAFRVTLYFPSISDSLPFPHLKGLLRPPKV